MIKLCGTLKHDLTICYLSWAVFQRILNEIFLVQHGVFSGSRPSLSGTVAAPPSQGAHVTPAAARSLAGMGITTAPPLMPVNLGEHCLGEAFAQHGGGVAVQGVRGMGGRQGTQEGGSTVAMSADKFAIQKCVKEYVCPKQKFVTDGRFQQQWNGVHLSMHGGKTTKILGTGGRLQRRQWKSQ
jgi:hypothetical protein